MTPRRAGGLERARFFVLEMDDSARGQAPGLGNERTHDGT
jgi:hypothetical protein